MDERIWEGLLSTALAILDDLDTRGLDAPEVLMGGDRAAPRRDLQLARLREMALAPEPVPASDVPPLGDFARLFPSMIGAAIRMLEREGRANQ
jgi:hypothetical protein